jgi:hypothetical protein
VPTAPPQLPTPIPLRRPRATGRSRPRAWRALGVSVIIHALAITGVLMAPRDRVERTARRSVEHATYVEIQWPRPHGTFQPPIPIPSASERAATGGYGVATQPPSDVAAEIPPSISSDSSALVSAPSLPSGGSAADAPGALPGTARVRMGAELGDSRLIVAARGGGMQEDDARYLVAFHAALRAFNDSVQGLADRESRVRAWTWTDSRGRVWGVRNGVILIAGQPVGGAEVTGDRDQELARRRLTRHREEIDFHADRVQRERHIQERGRAVRERREGERAGGGP